MFPKKIASKSSYSSHPLIPGRMPAWIILSLILLIASAQDCSDDSPRPQGDFLVNLPQHFGRRIYIPEDNPMRQEVAQLGRWLFYDTRLSKDSTVSCATCHQQKRAFTDGLATAEGIRKQKHSRNTMALVNMLWTDRFFWDGRAQRLEEQAFFPLEDAREMDLDREEAALRLQNIPMYPPLFAQAFGSPEITPRRIVQALAQFERTLISSESRYDSIVRGDIPGRPRELQAIQLFMTHPIPEANIRGGNCGDCHGSHLTTLNTFHNNGLDSISQDLGLEKLTQNPFDRGKMRAPSLRNIALTAPYMHDGRFKTLREVLDHYNEHIQDSEYLDPLIQEASNEPGGESLLLTEQEKEDLLLFLNLLTDSSFIQNPQFSNPFKSGDAY